MASFGLLVVVLAFVPTNQAVHPEDQNMLAVYFGVPKVTFTGPTSTTDVETSLCTKRAADAAGDCGAGVTRVEASNAGVGPKLIPFGVADSNGAGGVQYSIVSDMILTVWLKAKTPQNQPVPIHGLTVGLRPSANGNDLFTLQSDKLRDADEGPVYLDSTPKKIVVSFPKPSTFTIGAPATVGLRLAVHGVGLDDAASPLNIYLVHSSVAHPSRLVFGINVDAGDNRLGTGAFRASLSNNALDLDFPEGSTTASRAIDAAQPPTVNYVLWGGTTADKDYDIVSDGIFNATLKLEDAGAAALVAAYAKLTIGGADYEGFTQFRTPGVNDGNLPHVDAGATAAPAAFRVTIALPIDGVHVAAGSLIELRIALQALIPQDDNTYLVQYGSYTAPSGVLAAAETTGGGDDDETTTTTTTTTATSTTTTSSNGGSSSSSSSGTSGSSSASTSDVEGRAKDIEEPPKALPSVTALVGLVGAALVVVLLRRKA